jgi:hypothetical protein
MFAFVPINDRWIGLDPPEDECRGLACQVHHALPQAVRCIRISGAPKHK